jgi:hypothetical protein
MRNEIVHPGPILQLLAKATRSGSQQNTGGTGNTQTKVASALRTLLSLSVVCIATGYGLDYREFGILVPVEPTFFSEEWYLLGCHSVWLL